MDTGLLLVAAFCGIWQFVSTTDFGYTLSDTLGQPVLVGALSVSYTHLNTLQHCV